MPKKFADAVSAHNETGALARVMLRDPHEAFASQAKIDAEWRALGYTAPPDFHRAVAEYDQFVEILAATGAEIIFARGVDATTLDSIYVRDAALPTDHGVVLCRMGKSDRAAEPALLGAALEAAGTPIHGSIAGAGTLEGGDVMWLAGNVLAVGRGYRTNDEGIRQLEELTAAMVDELVVVPLPHWQGPGDVFHLMSIASPIDDDVILAYPPLLPVTFHEWLLERAIRIVAVPGEEFAGMACNVLALAPGSCLMLEGNPVTRRRLEKAGIEVRCYAGEEISAKGQGGPTCLTRPLLRQQ